MTARAHALSTRLLHAGLGAFDDSGAAPVNVPVVRTSTVRFGSGADYERLHRLRHDGENVATYGRHGTATHRALEAAIGELEGADHTLLAPSGMAAITLAFLSLLSPGDHALIQDSVYGPVRERLEPLLARLGVDVTYFAAKDGVPAHALRPATRLVYVESPGSFLYEIADLPALGAFAEQHGLILAADNTWSAGWLHQPLAHGAHVSVQASTKYIGGHSDLMQGAISTNDPGLALRFRDTHEALGLAVGADDAYLALRGIRTLGVRLARHAQNALEVARFLQQERAVARVFHPALPDDPGHALWRRDFSGANGLVSFAFADGDIARAGRFIDSLQLFSLGASWGGYESLALLAPPSRLRPHSYFSGDAPVVRLHVGLEDAADLIDDLRRAFRLTCT
ncbi:cystathionine beta-lyase [Caballeronia sp. LZ016]|uniref:cystathionine beta-lyase n=1 Tax=Caballeronia sp. LZ016 TaxID=3038554 RepID=UPI00285B44C5|nr:cystathionine beta-lyase [Caballeronia sp. LZ016]MDR5740037.1 cystathionine beta-lyase [Caballeronia sp. LZ016]